MPVRVPAGAGLRAAFACDPAALGGFGGVVMRLRGEGHGQVHVVGPPGVLARDVGPHGMGSGLVASRPDATAAAPALAGIVHHYTPPPCPKCYLQALR